MSAVLLSMPIDLDTLMKNTKEEFDKKNGEFLLAFLELQTIDQEFNKKNEEHAAAIKKFQAELEELDAMVGLHSKKELDSIRREIEKEKKESEDSFDIVRKAYKEARAKQAEKVESIRSEGLKLMGKMNLHQRLKKRADRASS